MNYPDDGTLTLKGMRAEGVVIPTIPNLDLLYWLPLMDIQTSVSAHADHPNHFEVRYFLESQHLALASPRVHLG
jgi:hypothetical protein